MKRLRVAVLGAGNLGLAQAGHLASMGHEVRLYNRGAERLGGLLAGQPLELDGVLNRAVVLSLSSTELAPVVAGADVIWVDVPASAHAEVAVALRAALPSSSAALLLLHPGQTFGARHFALRLGLHEFPQLSLAEVQTAIYTARSKRPGQVSVLAIKRQVALAAYPASHADRLGNALALYPQLWVAPSSLQTALMNVQSFIHPAVVLFNLTRIEQGEAFQIYRQGLTPALGAFCSLCDEERLALAQRLGVSVPSAAAWFEQCYGVRGASAVDAMRRVGAYDGLLGPTSLRTRLLSEDVPTGLAPLVELGQSLGVPMPASFALLAMARLVMEPSAVQGWDLKALGLSAHLGTGLQAAF